MANKITYFRATKDERRALEIMALREGRSISAMLRELIREGAERRGLAAVGLVDLLGEKMIEGGLHDA